ncbi:hypothetical protein CS8_096510 [Cupriavidus sp. 8B]
MSVLQVIDGRERLHPKPNGLLPALESWENASRGLRSERPGLAALGTDIEAVTGLAANFSPIPQIAPPPLGSDIDPAIARWRS